METNSFDSRPINEPNREAESTTIEDTRNGRNAAAKQLNILQKTHKLAWYQSLKT